MKILRAKVVRGVGDSSHWMRKLESYYSLRTGVKLLPVALHIQLERPLLLPKNALRLMREETDSNTSLNMLPCYLNGVKVFLLQSDRQQLFPEKNPLAIIEITADMDLIESLALKNGDEVEVVVPMMERALLK
jgi:CTP-dependent riboflavin kinase